VFVIEEKVVEAVYAPEEVVIVVELDAIALGGESTYTPK
jgi:hypothetical protein